MGVLLFGSDLALSQIASPSPAASLAVVAPLPLLTLLTNVDERGAALENASRFLGYSTWSRASQYKRHCRGCQCDHGVTLLTLWELEMGVSRFGRCHMEAGKTSQERRARQPWDFEIAIFGKESTS